MTVFEDAFSEAQIGMVSAALDYASGQADNVYIYFSVLGGILHTDVFFARDGRVYSKHKLPDVDTSSPQQQALLGACLLELENLCQAGVTYNRPIPIEGYLHYRVGGSLDARYSYDDIPVGEDPQWLEKMGAWRESVQKGFDAEGVEQAHE